MSEQNLPTLEQIDGQIPQCYHRIGVLDAEMRKVLEPYTEMGKRLEQIEAEKAEIHRILASLEHTRELVVAEAGAEKEAGDEVSED